MNRLAVILVSYNSRNVLGPCLNSLLRQDVDDVDIVVVDNHSGDGTPDWLQRHYPGVTVIAAQTNLGYGAAANLGLRQTTAGVALVANPDTVFTAESLQTLLRVIEEHPESLVMPKLLRPDRRVNAVGLSLHLGGVASCRGLGDDAEHYRGLIPVPIVSGAVIAGSRATWARSGGFDPDIFLYMEDVELSLRARFVGIPLYCAADAVVVHDYHLELTPQKFHWLERHRLWTVYKVYTWRTLLRLQPTLLLLSVLIGTFALLRGRTYLKGYLLARWWVWRRVPLLMRQRRDLNIAKSCPDRAIMQSLATGLPLEQLMAERWWSPPLARASEWIFRLMAPIASTPGGRRDS